MQRQELTAPLADIYSLNLWVKYECDKVDLKAVFKTGIPAPYTTKDSVVIPAFNASMTDDDVTMLRFFVKHECAHHQYGSGVFEIMDKYKLDARSSHLAHIFNLIEDERIERAAAHNGYSGDRRAILEGRRLFSEREGEKLKEVLSTSKTLSSINPDGHKLLALMAADYDARADWDSGTTSGRADTVRIVLEIPEVAYYYKKLDDFKYADQARVLKNEHDSFDFAKTVYELLFDSPAEQELERLTQQAEKLAPTDKKKGKTKGSKDEGKDVEQAAVQEYDRNAAVDSSETSGGSDDVIQNVIVKNLVLTDHKIPTVNTENNGGQYPSHLDYTHYNPSSTFVPIPENSIATVKLPPASVVQQELPQPTSPAFAEKIRRLIQIQAACRYEGGRKKGKLHNKNLYRWAMPSDIVSAEFRSRIFREKVESETLDVAVTLLVDCSGSMYGLKFQHASSAAAALEHVFSRVLHIPVEVLGHTTDDDTGISLRMFVIKAFADRVPVTHVASAFKKIRTELFGNADADAIWWAYRRLVQQRAKRKIMIVLSDGSPADAAYNSDPFHGLKMSVKEIEDSKRYTGVEIYGVGIMDSNVRHFYKHHIIVNNATELEQKLIELLGNIVLRNNRGD